MAQYQHCDAACSTAADRAPTPQSGLAVLQEAVLQGVYLLLKWQRRARSRGELAELTDHQLRDVGLSRADIAKETNKPFWEE
ncbi:DUF1127 domain-containing protein [uncultured Ferrovibrio sp.]|jgi:uncharacterized protein YjiS (DUF1127 family)|uniref:DUF1127 domain-containing protein n=1 Tax=uncultured Ferrovibrio sp. TaxID=1576913 RepID=UPI00261F1270|nr:DUF1127 domain-containing protein [uncultured Ferrovibrio sp.]